MAFTQADLDGIRACIASGVMRTRFADGREVVYQSLDQIMAAERRIAADVAATAPNAGPRRRTASYSNGL